MLNKIFAIFDVACCWVKFHFHKILLFNIIELGFMVHHNEMIDDDVTLTQSLQGKAVHWQRVLSKFCAALSRLCL